MKTLRTVAEVRAHVAPARRAGRSVGLVPTMGAFHGGHEALMRAARETCAEVIVSLFVNPTQFEEPADLAAYPRGEAEDAAAAAALGVDALFAPAVEAIYPDGFATTIHVGGLADVLEGAERGPGHFAGVCTVIAKLFNVVTPDVAVFGQKDAQQVAVIRRLVRDLDIPVRVEALPTVREPDGLALSSRNVRLAAADRDRALALKQGLDAAAAAASTTSDPTAVHAAAVAAMRERGVDPEYLALVNPDTFVPVDAVDGDVLVAVAARVGDVRLIDNQRIHRNGSAT